MTDHVCSTCGLKRPECGNKREQKEGYCRKWVSSKARMSESSWETKAYDCVYYEKSCIGKDCSGCPYQDGYFK